MHENAKPHVLSSNAVLQSHEALVAVCVVAIAWPAVGLATADSSLDVTIYLHGDSGTVFLEKCSNHDDHDCTSQIFASAASHLSKWAETEVASDLRGFLRLTRVKQLEPKSAGQLGLRIECSRPQRKGGTTTCALFRDQALVYRGARPSRIASAAGTVLVLTATNRPRGIEDHFEDHVVLLPAPRRRDVEYATVLEVATPGVPARIAARLNARGLVAHRQAAKTDRPLEAFLRARALFARACVYRPLNATYLANQAAAFAMAANTARAPNMLVHVPYYKRMALELCGRALAIDPARTRQTMERDRDFRSLRSDRRFQQLLRRRLSPQ